MTETATAGQVEAGRLITFIERLERLDEEKQAAADQFKEVMAEAKAEGYDGKTIAKMLALRKLKPHDRAEQLELFDLYRGALGM